MKKYIVGLFLIFNIFVFSNELINEELDKFFREKIEEINKLLDIPADKEILDLSKENTVERFGEVVKFFNEKTRIYYRFFLKNKELEKLKNLKIGFKLFQSKLEVEKKYTKEELKEKSVQILSALYPEKYKELEYFGYDENSENLIFWYYRKLNDYFILNEYIWFEVLYDGRVVSIYNKTTEETADCKINISHSEAEIIAEKIISKIVDPLYMRLFRFITGKKSIKYNISSRSKLSKKYPKTEIGSKREGNKKTIDYSKPVYVHPNYYFQYKGFTKNNSILTRKKSDLNLVVYGEHFIRLAHVIYFDLNGYKISGLPYISVAVDTETGEIIGRID